MSDDSESHPIGARQIAVVGLGRAGLSFARALEDVGWTVHRLGRGADLAVASNVDLALICTPDAVIADVAAAIPPGDAVVGHVAGSLGLEVLNPHRRRTAIHPLISLPNAEVGAQRLRASGWFGVGGEEPIAAELVAALGGRSFRVRDEDRAVYHAAACIAANHVVALMGQVERLAAGIDVPREAYDQLTRAAVDNAVSLGAAEALTGPAARGDDATIARHLAHLPADERASYEAMVHEARRLAEER